MPLKIIRESKIRQSQRGDYYESSPICGSDKGKEGRQTDMKGIIAEEKEYQGKGQSMNGSRQGERVDEHRE